MAEASIDALTSATLEHVARPGGTGGAVRPAAAPAAPSLVEIQNTVLFATGGQKKDD